MPILARLSTARLALTAMVLGIALLGGCATQEEIDALPGLGQVVPIGPKGKKCFEYCAQAKVACDEMCPRSVGICQDDCITESKNCLVDCPELQRPAPPPK